jgi:thiosulfate/3-mercaptopyruvate sulfurtransferase
MIASRWLIVPMVAGALTAGCDRSDPQPAAGTGEAAVRSVSSEVFITAEELRARMETEATLVLEVGRDTEAYDAGHVPTARFVSFGPLVVEVDGVPNEMPPVEQLVATLEAAGVSDDGRMLVVYGPPLLAARAYATLDYLGLGPRASVLAGGRDAWEAASGSLSRDVPESTRGSLTVAPRSDRIVTAEWIRDRLGDDRIAVLDARPLDQYTGEVPGTGIARPGHIAGGVHLYWEDTRTASGPLAEEALSSMFANAGAEPGDTVVAYCRTGIQASYLYAVSRALGYETRLYDASYMDWSARDELPVRTGGRP